MTTALNGTGGHIGAPRVAVDDAGNAYAAWTEGPSLEVSKRPVGGVFETPQTLDTGSGVTASVPDIGVDGAGNAVVVWRHVTSAGAPILEIAFRHAADSSFGAGTTLTVASSSGVGPPRIAVNRAGDAVVVYEDQETSSKDITAHLATTTSTAADFIAARRNVADNATPGDPEVAINDAGDAALVYVSTASGTSTVLAAYRPRGGSFPSIAMGFEQVRTGTAAKTLPQLAVEPDGGVVAVWHEGANGAVGAEERAFGKWSPLSNLDNPTATGDSPHVAFEPDGTGVAAWAADRTLRGSLRAPGSALADFGAFQAYTDSNESPADLALDSGPGNTVLAWDNSNAELRAMVRLGGSPFSPIATLSPTGHGGTQPDVEVDAHGNAAAVWVDTSPVDQNPLLAIAEYDSTRPSFTGLDVPVTATTGQALTMSASATDDWATPTITWDFGDGTTGLGGSVTHTYAVAGTYSLTATATDAAGNTRALSGTVVVSDPAVPPSDEPTRGVDFNASLVSGKVLVSVPKNAPAGRVLARRPVARSAAAISPPHGYLPFRLLGKDDNIPVGSILDASKGVSSLTMAANASGTVTQIGKFSLGVFKTTQSKTSALTTANMLGGGNFKRDCTNRRVRTGSGKVIAARKRPSRRLFASVKGRFRTRGRNSTATVRGTKYLVKDSCSGTTTKVVAGVVVVRDLVKHKNHTVRKGHSFTARPRNFHRTKKH